MKRILFALTLALAPFAALAADNNFPTPGASTVPGAVNMCLNSSGQAVPCAISGGTVSGPTSATFITAASGNVANAAAVATLAAAAGKTTYICGFTLTGAGATAALVVNATVANVITGTMTYTFGAVAGAAVMSSPVIVSFDRCIPANAANTTIVVTLPALGAGNTNAAATAWGYQL